MGPIPPHLHPTPELSSLPLVYNWILNKRENKDGKEREGAQQPLDPPLLGLWLVTEFLLPSA